MVTANVKPKTGGIPVIATMAHMSKELYLCLLILMATFWTTNSDSEHPTVSIRTKRHLPPTISDL